MKEEKFQTNKYCIYDDDILGTNACTECTGLMPTPASNIEEWETYQDIFQFSPMTETRSVEESSVPDPKDK